ncbi:MAG: type II secretion system F family protein [Raoultibacter sp.]|jgi:type IV pilus assembly protein PilC
MATYTYTGVSDTGEKLKGVVEAYDEIEAMERARELVYIVQEVKKVNESSGIMSMEVGKPRIKPKDIAIVCSQFAIILRAGLSAARAVRLVADQTSNKYLKKVLDECASDVEAGHGLADSLENKGKHLPRVFVETIRAGEESGHLAECFLRLQDYYEKRAKVASKVAGAVTYPIFVLVIGVVVVAVMMVMVIPTMTGMISSMGSDMPAITQFLIDTSDWFSANILWVILVAILIVVGIKLFGRTEQGKVFFGELQMKIPVTGKIVRFAGAGQFANTMATLIAAGLPTARAVQVTARVMSNYVLSREIGRIEAALLEGRSLGECMEGVSQFPRTLIEMTTVGEQTGELEETLGTIGEFYDSETQRVTDRALSLMEPALLVVMAVFAGFIVIALYLPMFSMYGSM